jgi:hypothetical protein
LLAYHYSLLNLTIRPTARYPGLVILDVPAELEEGTSIADKENFVVQPFIDLLTQRAGTPTQIISAGSAFEGLQGVNRIELNHIWKESIRVDPGGFARSWCGTRSVSESCLATRVASAIFW